MKSNTPVPPSDRAARGGSSPAVRRRRLVVGIAAGALTCALIATLAGVALSSAGGEPEVAVVPTSTPTATPTPTPTPRPQPDAANAPALVDTFDKNALSIDDPNSIWVVVNKHRPLNPVDYVPGDLVDVPVAHTWGPVMRQEASDAIVALFAGAADEAGLGLASNSAYRSYSTQQSVYADDVAANSQAYADTSTARPGHSEHQTGLTMDIGASSGNCSLSSCFADTAEGEWLAANAWRFGFLLRYPADKAEVTGIDFEPWHYRYIGTSLAGEMHERGITTLEEFFGLEAAPDYL